MAEVAVIIEEQPDILEEQPQIPGAQPTVTEEPPQREPVWQKTACCLCYVNCGLEIATVGREIVKIKGDKSNPKSKGYLCQKPQRLNFYGNHADRLTTPLRRNANGVHEPIDWDTALGEIADRLRSVHNEYGGPAFAFYGGGGQGNHLGGAYFKSLFGALGASKYFSALSQEKTGDFWVNGKLFGNQSVHTSEDIEHCDLLVLLGCNPWQANGFQNARNEVNAFKKTTERRMIVIDPRRTEVADVADCHLALRPGTDAYLLAAIIKRIIERGDQDQAFLDQHTSGFDAVQAALLEIVSGTWIEHAGVSEAEVEHAVDLIVAAERMVVRVELGIQQGRNSTLNSYLEKLLYLVTGHFGRKGTNNLHTWIQPLFMDTSGQRSIVTGQEIIGGYLPPNRFADEILTDHPMRARVGWFESSNPANSAADTTRFKEAVSALELSVTIDVAFTETAALCDYVLPAASQYEKAEYVLFTLEWPTNYFHLRAPVFEPLAGSLPEPEIYRRLFEKMELLPEQALIDELTELAKTDRGALLHRAFEVFGERPELVAIAPMLLYLTLGQTLPEGLAGAAPLWVSCQRLVGSYSLQVQRAIGSTLTGVELANQLFDAIVASPTALAFTTHTYDEVWQLVKHGDSRVHLDVPELLAWIGRLDPILDQPDPQFPYVLVAGQRRGGNANQILRDPKWRKADFDGALGIHSSNLADLGGIDGGWLAVTSPVGRLICRVAVDDRLRLGVVTLPNGYGQNVPDGNGGRIVVGPQLNYLTSAQDCDPIAATPYHKNVAVHLSLPSDTEIMAAEQHSQRTTALAQ
jgi:anaerobic selenocysteine-containing dehydrogenase